MSRAVIRLGDFTSHGGRVIEATARMTIDGIPVALWGDHCSCPILGHDNCVICEGEVQAMFDGRPVALEGHKTSCGATLIPSQKDRCDCMPITQKVAARTVNAARAGNTAMKDIHEAIYDEQIQLMDPASGESLINEEYEIQTESGEIYRGITDSEGKTLRVQTDGVEQLSLYLVG